MDWNSSTSSNDEDSMSDNVVKFPGSTTLDLPPDNVLEGAKGQLEIAIVIGRTADGEEYFAGSSGDLLKAFVLLSKVRHRILSGEYGDLWGAA
jgi:hypothetical protein